VRALCRVIALLAGVVLPAPAAADAAARNGRIAFEVVQEEMTCDQCGPNGESMHVGGGSRVWLARPDGRRVRRLPCSHVRRTCSQRRPAFSNDGRRLALENRADLLVLTPGGRVLRRVESFPGWSVVWGPGDRRFFFFRSYARPDNTTSWGVAVGNLEGAERRLHSTLFPGDLAWSRHGLLAWVVLFEGGAPHGVWVGDVRGRRKRRITRIGQSVSWSPDGSRLAVLGTSALHLIDADGGRRRVLTRQCAGGYEEDGGVAWSPDGREIACRSRRGNLVVLNLATMTLRPLATWRQFGNGSVGEISWQPVPGG
jgi:WD40-like Beta Propeller Repeat